MSQRLQSCTVKVHRQSFEKLNCKENLMECQQPSCSFRSAGFVTLLCSHRPTNQQQLANCVLFVDMVWRCVKRHIFTCNLTRHCTTTSSRSRTRGLSRVMTCLLHSPASTPKLYLFPLSNHHLTLAIKHTVFQRPMNL